MISKKKIEEVNPMKYLLILLLLLASCTKVDNLPKESAIISESTPEPTPFEMVHTYDQLSVNPLESCIKRNYCDPEIKEVAPNVFLIKTKNNSYEIFNFNEFKLIKYRKTYLIDEPYLEIIDFKEHTISSKDWKYFYLTDTNNFATEEFKKSYQEALDQFNKKHSDGEYFTFGSSPYYDFVVRVYIHDVLDEYYDGYHAAVMSCLERDNLEDAEYCDFSSTFSLETLSKYADTLRTFIEENYDLQSTITEESFYIDILYPLLTPSNP